jgi:8-oxo-dGTP pyrophosphatase MutT (NUDIX family)
MRAYEFIFESEAEHRAALEKTGFWGAKAAGCVFMAMDTRRLCLSHRSSQVEQPNTWGTWGGAIDAGEAPEVAAKREVREEAGYDGPMKLVPLFVFRHSSGFEYHNFLALVASEFAPEFDWETQGSSWFKFGQWPKPLHPGMITLLNDPASVDTIKEYLLK